MKAVEREAILAAVRADSFKHGLLVACRLHLISKLTFNRWSDRYAQGGVDALADRPRSGRPRKNKGAVA